MASATGQDSGVETECDLESNDSSLSSVGVIGAAANPAGDERLGHEEEEGNFNFSVPSGTVSPTPEHLLSSMPASGAVMPPPSVTEDGYLGDCSSDGGNEKNFPMPPEKLKRLLICRTRSEDGDQEASGSALTPDVIEPPAGLSFLNVRPDLSGSCGYQVNSMGGGGSRKMKSVIKGRLNNWSHMKANLAGRKIRMAANTNNVESLEHLLSVSGADPNDKDEHQRTALHFAAAKGYTEIVRLLLDHGADPNQKDTLGNTALHLAACTNHVGVVTLLLRSGTNVSELDNNGRTPMQLAQSKLKLLQRSRAGATEMTEVKSEVAQVIEMMREYLIKIVDRMGHGTNQAYNDLLNSFSYRLNLHQTHDDINSDLQNLLESLGNLQV